MHKRMEWLLDLVNEWLAWVMAVVGIILAWVVFNPSGRRHHGIQFDWWKLILAVVAAGSFTAHQEIFRGGISRNKTNSKRKSDKAGKRKRFFVRMFNAFAYGFMSGAGFGSV